MTSPPPARGEKAARDLFGDVSMLALRWREQLPIAPMKIQPAGCRKGIGAVAT